MCGSRKYPYPTTEGILLRTPHLPGFSLFIRNCDPTPPEFPQSKTKPVPTPRIRLSLELEHSKLPTKHKLVNSV